MKILKKVSKMKDQKTENRNQSQPQNPNHKRESSNQSKVGNILDITVDKMRALADTGLVIGDKIPITEDITLIPVSRVS